MKSQKTSDCLLKKQTLCTPGENRTHERAQTHRLIATHPFIAFGVNLTFSLSPEQGDQIDRANFRPMCDCLLWVGFFENFRSRAHFRATFFPQNQYVLIFTKNGFGYILG
jgi:hypothetical protein